MGETTGIAWTNHTHNEWIGCDKVSPGCTNCYAEVHRAVKILKVEWGKGKPRHLTSIANRRKPLAWNRAAEQAGERRRVFSSSLSDWLDPAVPAPWLAGLLGLIDATPNLDWQLLTKRPDLWRERMAIVVRLTGADVRGHEFSGRKVALEWLDGNAPPNVWLGTTVEDQRRADERIPALLQIPARVRFLSMEPLLEAVDLETVYGALPESAMTCHYGEAHRARTCDCAPGVDWVIVGGESGAKARAFSLAWARDIVQLCENAGVAVFVKQMGDNPRDFGDVGQDDCEAKLLFAARQGADPTEWPEDLRIQQFPQAG